MSSQPVLPSDEAVNDLDAIGRGDRVSRAYSHLRELIVWGRLAPGTRIIETDIATRLGVSRTPVRSALHRLQQEGYILESDSGLQSRLTVAPLTKEDARELFAIVTELESLAAGFTVEQPAAARGLSVATLRQTNGALAEAAAASPRPDPKRIFELDQVFHNGLVSSGAGPRLLALHDAVKPQTERYVRLYISALLDEIGTSVDEHEKIIDAVASGSATATRACVRKHWKNSTDRMCQVIESAGERGTW